MRSRTSQKTIANEVASASLWLKVAGPIGLLNMFLIITTSVNFWFSLPVPIPAE